MSVWLGALLVGAAGVATWLHLSARARRKGRPFPSVQHLGGTPLPRRPTWPVEQPLRWLLRLGAMALLALALWGLGRGPGAKGAQVALVDPAGGDEGWRRARALRGVAAVAGFEGDQPRVEGDDARAARVRARLEACSARTVDCLLRAATAGEARTVVVGDFVDGAWSAALAGMSFDFVRLGSSTAAGASTPGRAPGSAAPAGSSTTGSATGSSPAAGSTTAGPAAAVSEASGAVLPPSDAAAGSPSKVPPAGRESDATRTSKRSGLSPPEALWRAALDSAVASEAPAHASPTGPLLDVRVVTEPGPAQPPCPATEQTEPRAIRWDGLFALATRRTAVPADATLRFQMEGGASRALDGLAARVTDRTLCLASTDRELGRWAHDGTLLVLGRALRAWVAPPLLLHAAPSGGTERWLDAAGATAGVGLADVPPGTYHRSDGQVLLSLARPETLAPEPLTDADLVARGGTPWRDGPSQRWSWPLGALLAVVLLRLVDLPERPSGGLGVRWRAAAVGAQLAGLAILTAGLLGAGWTRVSMPERWIRILGPAGADADAALNAAGVRTVRGSAPLACAGAASESPCVEAARASAELQQGIDTRVADASAPRLTVLDVQLPAEVPLGMAAQLRVDVRLQRARGATLAVEARAPGAPPVTEQRTIASDDAVLRLDLALLPAAEGVLPVEVSARAGPAADAQLHALVVRRRPVHRLLLAGAPSWEARRAAEVLDVSPATLDVVTRVGRTVTASRPRALPAPSALLTSPGTLDGYRSIVLVDPGDWLGPDAVAGLTSWVERGGGLVVLGRARLPATLAPGPSPAGPAGPPHRLQAHWGGKVWSLQGFDAADGARAPGSVVLGEAGPSEQALRPWIIGRTVGQGRVLQVLAEDAWRLSPPGGDGTRLSTLLGGVLAWVEAAHPAPRVRVTEDARSVLWADDAGGHRTAFGLGQTVLGLELAGLPAALDLPIRLRAEAVQAGRPWIEPASWPELGKLWARAPAPAVLRRQQLIRAQPAAWVLWVALLTAEIALRRSRRRTGPDPTDQPAPLEVEALRRSA